MFELMKGDCLELMKAIPDASVDLILCDLPYGTTQNKWDSVIDLQSLWSEYRRICRGPVVLTSAQPFTTSLIQSNMRQFHYCWYWRKNRATNVLNAKKMPLREVEEICVFSVGKKTYNPQGLVFSGEPSRNSNSDSENWGSGTAKKYIQEYTNYPKQVLEFDSVQRTVHPTQKPVALMEYLIRTYTHEGMTVLDNCFGSGTTGVACANTGRKFIGIEMDEKYFEIAKNRVESAYSKNELEELK